MALECCSERACVTSPTAAVRTQVVIDEVVFTPLHIAAFFSFLTAAEGGNWQVGAAAHWHRSIVALHTLPRGSSSVLHGNMNMGT